MKRLTVWLSLSLLCWPLMAAKYKVLDLQVRAADEYAHQDFQNVIIGARPYDTSEEIQLIFDTKKMYERNIMPVLLVIENNNDFPLRILAEDVYLNLADGSNVAPIPVPDVLLSISLKKPPASYSTRKDILLERSVKPNIARDFEHKAFGEKLVPPLGSDYGIIFFPLIEEDQRAGARLYLPEVENMATGENLIFFEFELWER